MQAQPRYIENEAALQTDLAVLLCFYIAKAKIGEHLDAGTTRTLGVGEIPHRR